MTEGIKEELMTGCEYCGMIGGAHHESCPLAEKKPQSEKSQGKSVGKGIESLEEFAKGFGAPSGEGLIPEQTEAARIKTFKSKLELPPPKKLKRIKPEIPASLEEMNNSRVKKIKMEDLPIIIKNSLLEQLKDPQSKVYKYLKKDILEAIGTVGRISQHREDFLVDLMQKLTVTGEDLRQIVFDKKMIGEINRMLISEFALKITEEYLKENNINLQPWVFEYLENIPPENNNH